MNDQKTILSLDAGGTNLNLWQALFYSIVIGFFRIYGVFMQRIEFPVTFNVVPKDIKLFCKNSKDHTQSYVIFVEE